MNLSYPQGQVFQSLARFIAIVAGRRFGKTHLMIAWLLKEAWGPGLTAWYIAPTYKQAKMITWDQLKATAGPWIAKTNETELSVKLVTGGTIRLHGAERYDTLRGPGINFAAFDEFADIDPRAWTEVIRPMLSDRKGRAVFGGTPKGFNHFKEMYSAAVSDATGTWAGFQYTTLQGGNVAPEEVAAARIDLDERTFRQEYEASFENLFSGRVYYAFNRSENVREVGFLPSGTLCWSLDFNVAPMCSVICQIDDFGDRRYGTMSVLDEIVLTDSNVWEVCEAFATRTKAWADRMGTLAVRIYGDATGNSREHTGPSSYHMIREFFANRTQYRVTYHNKASNPAVIDRVNAVNAMLCNAEGARRLFIDPKCKSVAKDMEMVSWKMDANDNATGQMDQRGPSTGTPAGLTHISDALGYLIETEFGMRGHGGPRSGYIG